MLNTMQVLAPYRLIAVLAIVHTILACLQLSKSSVALCLIAGDMLILFYARPYNEACGLVWEYARV